MRFGLRAISLLIAGAQLPGAAFASTVPEFVDLARDADIVVLGEVHDNPAHHVNQAEIVAALRPAALVFEMIPQADEEKVNELRATGAGRAAIAAALEWDQGGWPDFAYYWRILTAAPRAQVFGAEQPRADVRRATLEGAAGVFGPDASNYGLDQPLPPAEQRLREAEQAKAHCDLLPPERLPGMVEAQRFRDAGLADAAIWARTMTGGGQVVVIAGSGHADKLRGMPALLSYAQPGLRVVTLGQFEADPENAGDYDALILAPAPAREDPCAGLGAAPEKPAP
ncbi:ChaN family lipoprotein [Amaricoccus solimangrovi]|nr:ChaN family lipoprotein [Amaricoccus solimangrovi]